jgi:hypothetical protein
LDKSITRINAHRNTFAILMLLRASNGTPSNLGETLSAFLPAGSKETVLKEWIPEAMGETRNYDPILGAVDAGEQPNHSLVLQMMGPQELGAMLGDLNSASAGASKAATFQNAADVVTTVQIATPDIGVGAGLDRRPFYYREPDGYQWQTSGARKKR